MNQQTQDFIQQFAESDVNDLALQGDKFPEVEMSLALRQIEGRQKIKHKVPAFYACRQLFYPPKLSLEQSSSELTAKYKAELCSGRKLVDLTGGFGIDCYFMSASFDETVYVERNEALCGLAAHNFSVLGRSNIVVKNETAEHFLSSDFTVDWIFIDPARRKKSGAKAVLLADCEPNVVVLQNLWFERTQHVMIKLSPMVDLVRVVRDLNFVSQIHVVAVNNECKEVVAVVEPNSSEKILIKSIHFTKNAKTETFSFNIDDEKNLSVQYAKQLGLYLYEPNAAILKSGAFKSIAEVYELDKLHVNSHLYTSNDLRPHFPGRIFEVKSVISFNKQALKTFNLKKANISVRNFPLSVNELRKKLKITDGGDDYLFATTLSTGAKVLVLCKKAELHTEFRNGNVSSF